MAYVVNILTEGVSRLWSTYIPTSPSNSRIYPHITVYTTILASIILAAVVVSSLTNSGSNDEVKVPYRHGIPFIGSWAFFTRRIRFIEEGFRSLGSAFRFNILHHKVLVVSGEEARKVFFGSKNLGLLEGYKVLLGGSPDLDGISTEREHVGDVTWFGKRVTSVLKKDRLAIVIPLMIADVDFAMRSWGNTGQFDTFDKIYNIVFQITIRAASCNEIANSPSQVKRITELYWNMEHGSTAATVLLPRLPSKARNLMKASTLELYQLVKAIVDDRRTTGRRDIDAMQVLIDEGDKVDDIVQFILSVLFAGIANTGIMASWILLFLHITPEWKSRAIAEVRSFISRYASKTSATDLPSLLSAIPPEVWDEGMPTLDVCLRETIRMVFGLSALRRVLSDGVTIDGIKVERGSFVVYSTRETHHNENIYTDPEKWDPGRFERGEDKKEQHAFLGWGVGRHPCLGMRFAKLEVKIILALFLTRYEYTLVDAQGETLVSLPEPNKDDLYKSPPSSLVFLKYTRVEG